MSKLGKMGIGVVVVILALGVISLLPVFPVTVSYQVVEREEVPVEVPVEFDSSDFVRVGWPTLFDWELQYDIAIENVSAVGGTFTVIANFYDGHRLASTTTDRRHIGAGETATFRLWSNGLSWSTDWEVRYTVRPEIRAPTKIETRIETRTVTRYRTERVNLIRLLAGE